MDWYINWKTWKHDNVSLKTLKYYIIMLKIGYIILQNVAFFAFLYLKLESIPKHLESSKRVYSAMNIGTASFPPTPIFTHPWERKQGCCIYKASSRNNVWYCFSSWQISMETKRCKKACLTCFAPTLDAPVSALSSLSSSVRNSLFGYGMGLPSNTLQQKQRVYSLLIRISDFFSTNNSNCLPLIWITVKDWPVLDRRTSYNTQSPC